MRFKKITEIKPIRIKKSKNIIDAQKTESEIEKDHVAYCKSKNILYFHTKIKGEPQMIGRKMIMKKSENSGFFDMILIFQNSVTVFLELKSGKGGVWASHQIEKYNAVINHGGLALCSNSVDDTDNFLKEKGLIK
jgi:hypothetical protein